MQVTCTIMHLTMFQSYPAFANVSRIETLLKRTWKRCKIISLGPRATGPSFSHPICNTLQLSPLARSHLRQVLRTCCSIPAIHRCFMKISWKLCGCWQNPHCCSLNQVQSASVFPGEMSHNVLMLQSLLVIDPHQNMLVTWACLGCYIIPLRGKRLIFIASIPISCRYLHVHWWNPCHFLLWSSFRVLSWNGLLLRSS